jgi:cell division septum initiation protein DivIVA
MSVYRVIDKMENVVKTGLWLPFGGRVVNSDRLLDLIEKLRSTLPEEATRGKPYGKLPGDAASSAAGNGMNAAQTRFLSKPGSADAGAPSEEEAASAQSKAEAILKEAQARSAEIRRGADEYADSVLSSLDATLARALATVQKGRQTLAATTPSNGAKTRETSNL